MAYATAKIYKDAKPDLTEAGAREVTKQIRETVAQMNDLVDTLQKIGLNRTAKRIQQYAIDVSYTTDEL